MPSTKLILQVVNGDRQTTRHRAGRRLSLEQDEQMTCQNCENQTGVATSRFRQAVICQRRRPDGSVHGGTKVWVCDYCDTQVS